MTGKKGRSGTIHTRGAQIARREASAKGGEAFREKMTGVGLDEEDGAYGLRTTEDFPGHCTYDKSVIRGKTSYGEARLREQVIQQQIMNEKLKTEIEIMTGKLLTADQVKARDDKWNATARLEAQKVERLCDGLEGFTPSMRTAFLERCRAWQKELGEHLTKAGG